MEHLYFCRHAWRSFRGGYLLALGRSLSLFWQNPTREQFMWGFSLKKASAQEVWNFLSIWSRELDWKIDPGRKKHGRFKWKRPESSSVSNDPSWNLVGVYISYWWPSKAAFALHGTARIYLTHPGHLVLLDFAWHFTEYRLWLNIITPQWRIPHWLS